MLPFLFAIAPPPAIYYGVGRADNDVLRALGPAVRRFEQPEEAVAAAPAGGAVIITASGYPGKGVELSPTVAATIARKRLRVFLEFPVGGQTKTAHWERAVVMDAGSGSVLPRLRLLALHSCVYVPAAVATPWLTIGRVAGFDTAVFGPPADGDSLLYEAQPDRLLVAATKISDFGKSRFLPNADWNLVWTRVLKWLTPNSAVPKLGIPASVATSFSATAPLPPDAERQAIARGIGWFE